MKTGYLRSQELSFKEPKEPKTPLSIINIEKKFQEGSMKMNPIDKKKELAMNVARKKAESVNLEDRLTGKAKEHARVRRLNTFKSRL